MDSTSTSKPISFASLARDLTIPISQTLDVVTTTSEEENDTYCLSVEEEEEEDTRSSYDEKFKFATMLYERCIQISQEALYPVMDRLHFEHLFAFLFPEEKLEEDV